MSVTPKQISKIQKLRYEQGLTAKEIADRVGLTDRTITKYAPLGRVNNAPLRSAFLKSDRTAADVARYLGWYDYNGRADGHRVKRALGLVEDISKQGYRSIRKSNYRHLALQLAKAIGVDPWELGL
ncbi:MAG TPA: hypothetical protein VN843_04050 [Anaerolineales bacterium]|nr:hypothetical protein [Anaerolineales bacterium]